MSCWCLVWCTNVAPQTRQDKQRMTKGKHGDGDGQRRGKRQRGRLKGAANKARAGETGRNAIAETKDHAPGQQDSQTPSELHRTEEIERGRGETDATGVPL